MNISYKIFTNIDTERVNECLVGLYCNNKVEMPSKIEEREHDVALSVQAITDALAHWGRDKMAAIFQTTFLNTFSCKIVRPRSHLLIVLKKVIPDTTRYDFV